MIEFNPGKELDEAKEKAEWRLNAFRQYQQELLANPEFHEYMKQFRNGDAAEFAKRYAHDKVRWMEWGPNYEKWQENEDLAWVNDAFERLEEIQQKKLFDLQCQWRAEKIELPGVEICDDFMFWEYHILNCPFLDPITLEEVELYMQYLRSSNFEFKQGFLDNWQDYKAIKKADQTGGGNRNFPDWYDFHNGRTGKSVYLLLPDVRGGKEDFYMQLWRKNMHEEVKRKQEEIRNDPNAEKRPHMDYHSKGFMKWFVTTYEDKETQQKFADFGGERDWGEFDDALEGNLQLLGKQARPYPVEGWFDFREAIQRTADKLRISKIADALPAAFEQYQMQAESGLGFAENDPEYWKDLRDKKYDFILRGRELNNEPRNLDF